MSNRLRATRRILFSSMTAAALIGGSLFAPAAHASILTFTDRTAWESAVAPAPILLEDFSPDAAGQVAIVEGTDTSVGLFRVFFETANGSSAGWRLDVGDGHFSDSRHLEFRTDPSGSSEVLTAEWRFDDAVFAFGADFEQINTVSDMELTFVGTGEAPLALNDWLSLDGPGSATRAGFLGVIVDSAFTRIAIDSSGTDQASVDNVSFAYSAVPEATSLAVWCGVTVAGALGLRRRRSGAR